MQHPSGRKRCTAKGSRFFALVLGCLLSFLPAFATKGVFQGLVVEGTKREAGKYIYVAGPSGSMRRVNIQNCRVRFDMAVPPGQRVRSALESLRNSAEVRVTAEQRQDGEWMAIEIVILKLPAIDKIRLLV
jgi:hypothetical protein